MKILIIEDEEGIVELTRRLLTRAEVSIREFRWVKTLADGLKAAADMLPDFILLDLRLSDSAREKTIQAIPGLDSIAPVLVLSGNDQCFPDCYERGAVDCLFKPVFLKPDHEAFLAHAIITAQHNWHRIHGR